MESSFLENVKTFESKKGGKSLRFSPFLVFTLKLMLGKIRCSMNYPLRNYFHCKSLYLVASWINSIREEAHRSTHFLDLPGRKCQ